MRPRAQYSYSHMAYATTSYDAFNETIETCLLIVNLLNKKYDDLPDQNLKTLALELNKHIELSQQCLEEGNDSDDALSRLLSVLYAINKNLSGESNFFPTKIEKLIHQIFMRLNIYCE